MNVPKRESSKMILSFSKKVCIGTCGGIMLVITWILSNSYSLYVDPKSTVDRIQCVNKSPVLKGGNSSVLKNDFDLPLSSECLLPLQWASETDSSHTSKPWSVLHQKENDTCLGLLIKQHCYKDKRIVPNVVHYVIFKRNPLRIYTFFSFLGTWKYVKPCFIVIHGDYPFGPLLEKFLTYKPRIIHVQTMPKKVIFGKSIFRIEHKADVARLEIIYKYGGIYLDYDEIPVKSFDPLRNHSVVLGQAARNILGNAVIIAEPSALFIMIWMATYRSYNPGQWAVHSTHVPFQLTQLLSNMVFTTPTFFKPSYLELDQLYDRNIDWSTFYGLHLYGKARIQNDTLEAIRYKDSTYGSVARYVYYGDKTLQKKGVSKKKKSSQSIKKMTP